MKNLEFLNFPQSYQPDNAFVVHISGVHNKRELLTKLSQKLLFPNGEKRHNLEVVFSADSKELITELS